MRGVFSCLLMAAVLPAPAAVTPGVQAQAAAGAVGDRSAVLRQAQNAYYNLRSRGLATFQCDVTPDWQLLLADEGKQNPEAADNAIQILNQLHFSVNLSADDTVKLTHNELTGQSQQMMDALKQIYGGMEQLTSSVFDTWKRFMITSPFPNAGGAYTLDNLGPRYKLAYREDQSDVATTMGHDFAIDTLNMTSPEFDSSIQPSFTSTPQGFVLASYSATYKSQNASETTQLDVAIDYAQVEGFEMLSKLSLKGTYGGTPFGVALAFSNCQVTKK